MAVLASAHAVQGGKNPQKREYDSEHGTPEEDRIQIDLLEGRGPEYAARFPFGQKPFLSDGAVPQGGDAKNENQDSDDDVRIGRLREGSRKPNPAVPTAATNMLTRSNQR